MGSSVTYVDPKIGDAYVVIHYPEDLTFNCPACEEQNSWPRKRNNFQCSECHVHLAGFELGNPQNGPPDWKPPRELKDPQLLGKLILHCPPSLASFPYRRSDKLNLLKMSNMDFGILCDAITYQANLYLEGKRKRIDVVANGLTAALQQKEAMSEDQTPSDTEALARVSDELAGVWERTEAALDAADTQLKESGVPE